MSNTQVIENSDTMELLPYGCVATATALEIPRTISRDDWMALFETIQLLEVKARARLRTIKFWLGDCIRYGEGRWGQDCYQVAIQETGYSDQTLANVAWVAGKIEPSRRRESPAVSFEHHAEVAGIEKKEDQDRWLAEAEKEELSVKALREQIRKEKDEDQGRDPDVWSANRALAQAREKVMAAPIEKWSEILIDHLIVPIGSDRPRVEYEAFLSLLGSGVQELISNDK